MPRTSRNTGKNSTRGRGRQRASPFVEVEDINNSEDAASISPRPGIDILLSAIKYVDEAEDKNEAEQISCTTSCDGFSLLLEAALYRERESMLQPQAEMDFGSEHTRSTSVMEAASGLLALGSLYLSGESRGDKLCWEEVGIHFLDMSTEADQSFYFLGRWCTNVGEDHEGFVLEKCEENVSTWCSIGVLDQLHNDPIDALLAYMYALILDGNHPTAWTNLGSLYESCGQLHDAYTCYGNAYGKSKTMNPNLSERIEFLQTHLANNPIPSVMSNQLPSIEEIWNQIFVSEQLHEGSMVQQQPGVFQNGTTQTQNQRRDWPTNVNVIVLRID